jgi:hypothetical protein
MYMWQRRCGRSAYFSLDQNCIFFTGPKVHIFHWTRTAYFSPDQKCIFFTGLEVHIFHWTRTAYFSEHPGAGGTVAWVYLWAAWPSSSMLLFVCFVYIVPAAYSSGSARAASSGPTTRCPRMGSVWRVGEGHCACVPGEQSARHGRQREHETLCGRRLGTCRGSGRHGTGIPRLMPPSPGAATKGAPRPKGPAYGS